MNQSVTRLTLDVSVFEKQAFISFRQFDTMRRLVFSLVDRGLPYKFESGVYAAVSAKTSATTYHYGGCIIQDGAVHFDVPPSMTNEPDTIECELVLFSADSRVLTSCGFDVVIFDSNAAKYAEEALKSNEFFAMTNATAQALDAAEDARNAADLANDAREDADAAAGRAVEISQTLENKLAAGEFKGEKGDPGDTGPIGPQGNRGEPGPQGAKGDTVFFRYSAYTNGLNFTDTWSAGQSYIGTYVGKEAPTDPGQYQWAKFTSNVRETITVNLSAGAWVDKVQTVESHYIGTESAAFVSPTPTSMTAYLESGVMLDYISESTLTFTCVSVPAEDISVEVNIIEPLVSAKGSGQGGGAVNVPDGQQPTESKFVMRDARGNLTAFTPDHMAYPNLLYSYTHEQNKEVYPTALNLATGEWTAVGHGLTQNQQVFVAIHPPYHIIGSYDQLPGGLLLGPVGGGGMNAQKYYVNVVDADTFTLSETSGGAVKTYTEVATMDLSRFHFEVFVQQVINISDLPDLTELLVVVNGRISNGYRYCLPEGGSNTFGKVPVGGYDSAYVDSFGSMFMGNGGGWGSLYATIEMKYVEAKHLLITYNVDSMSYKTDGMPLAHHERAYIHRYMTVDAIKKLSFQQGQFMNGTTVEVYTK